MCGRTAAETVELPPEFRSTTRLFVVFRPICRIQIQQATLKRRTVYFFYIVPQPCDSQSCHCPTRFRQVRDQLTGHRAAVPKSARSVAPRAGPHHAPSFRLDSVSVASRLRGPAVVREDGAMCRAQPTAHNTTWCHAHGPEMRRNAKSLTSKTRPKFAPRNR